MVFCIYMSLKISVADLLKVFVRQPDGLFQVIVHRARQREVTFFMSGFLSVYKINLLYHVTAVPTFILGNLVHLYFLCKSIN